MSLSTIEPKAVADQENDRYWDAPTKKNEKKRKEEEEEAVEYIFGEAVEYIFGEAAVVAAGEEGRRGEIDPCPPLWRGWRWEGSPSPEQRRGRRVQRGQTSVP